MIIGTLVKFKIPSLNGLRTIAGTVKRVMPDGKLEVKAQQGGYYVINASEIL